MRCERCERERRYRAPPHQELDVHVGSYPGALRYQLGLHTPPADAPGLCALKVGGGRGRGRGGGVVQTVTVEVLCNKLSQGRWLYFFVTLPLGRYCQHVMRI